MALISEKRIEKITVREISAKAGYNRGTFYEYFTDVYDVLAAIEDALLPKVADMPPLLPVGDQANLPIDSFVKLYSQSSEYYAILLGENGDPAFAGKLKKGMKAKLLALLPLKEQNDVRLDYALEYMLSAMIGVMTYWVQNQESLPQAQLVQLMYELMASDGIASVASRLQR